MVFSATVTELDVDETGVGWATLEVALTVTDPDGVHGGAEPTVATTATVRVALPRPRRQPLGAPRRRLEALTRAHRPRARVFRGTDSETRETDHVEPGLHRRAGHAARHGPRPVRPVRLERDRPRARGRPGRVLDRAVGPARRARPARPAPARGARRVRDVHARRRRRLRGTGPCARPDPPPGELRRCGRRAGARRFRRPAQRVAATDRLRRGDPHPGLARARQQLRAAWRADACRARR